MLLFLFFYYYVDYYYVINILDRTQSKGQCVSVSRLRNIISKGFFWKKDPFCFVFIRVLLIKIHYFHPYHLYTVLLFM